MGSWVLFIYGVWVFVGEGFDCGWCVMIRVVFMQYWVNGIVQYFVIMGMDFFFFVSFWVFFVFWYFEVLFVQFFDGCVQLWDGGRDVWQFDDVGVWIFGVFVQFGQGIWNLLIFFKVVWEVCQNMCCEGDIVGFKFDVSWFGVGFQDGKK